MNDVWERPRRTERRGREDRELTKTLRRELVREDLHPKDREALEWELELLVRKGRG